MPAFAQISVKKWTLGIVALFVVSGCASLYDDFDQKLLENKEYDREVKIKPVMPAVPWSEPLSEKNLTLLRKGKKIAPKAEPKPVAPVVAAATVTTSGTKTAATTGVVKHEPSMEPSEGFNGRRPIVDPFREGEEVVYSASYFGVEAGQVTIGIKPFVQVNGKKSYHLSFRARSSSVFSVFYNVDDYAESFLDYEELIPYSYSIKARETKQIRDVKTYFDWKTMKAKMWDKKIKKGKPPEEKNETWDLLPFSQNVFSVAFYVRTFDLRVGKEIAVRVAHEGKNIIMKGKVIRQEKLKTAAGEFDTVVIKPQFEIQGVFKPVGDIFIWFTNDDRKQIVRIESKIKIGTVVVAAVKVTR